MGGAPSIPQQNLGQEFGQIIKLLPNYGQAQANLAQKFAPQYAQQDVDLSKQFAPQYAQEGLNIGQQFAPQYEKLNLGQMQGAIAGSPLLASANQQVLGRLNQQGQLSPQEAYQTTQGTLGSFAGRNNVFNQAEAQSFLNRDALVRQRQTEALGQAQSLQGTNLGTLQGIGGVAQSPNLAAYGAPGAAFTPYSAGIGATQGTTQPVMGFAQNVFDANQNAAATQSIAGANKGAGLTGAGIGAIGSLGAAAIGL